jgi:hypothetical protein
VTNTSTASTPTGVRAARTALAILAAAAASVVVVAVIAAIAHAAGARHDFKPLTPGSYLPLTVLGVAVGGIGWQMVHRRAARPVAMLRWLVPGVIVVSLVPDLAVGISGSQPGTTWGAVAALMVMHLAVASIAVPAFQRLMPAA